MGFSSTEVRIKKIKDAGALNLSPCSSVQQLLWHPLSRNHYQPCHWSAKFLQPTVTGASGLQGLEYGAKAPSAFLSPSLKGLEAGVLKKAFWSVGYITTQLKSCTFPLHLFLSGVVGVPQIDVCCLLTLQLHWQLLPYVWALCFTGAGQTNRSDSAGHCDSEPSKQKYSQNSSANLGLCRKD